MEIFIELLNTKSGTILLFLNSIFFPVFVSIFVLLKLNKTIKRLEKAIITLVEIEIARSDSEDLLREKIEEVIYNEKST